ncbi:dienelactone hydrolase family protein [Actinomarinicola tropica]|uniref:Dienelactone hydrolase family protein n=1 Tax=Actinomarinicola tropica TaxID=2789776 RepID=A0A5Q2RQ60_9ACTN|nr:dienelactone hydrolase family protein [Actinomarinicola tropica]QGG96576.1 dienelactone hydrolase family protein [Actinomarinicola tropica]
MPTTRTETISLHDGEMGAHLAVPDTGTGPGVLVIQEIGGVNAYMRDVAERLAAAGYVALVPDVFWRVQPGFAVDTFNETTLGQAMKVAGQVDGDACLADLGAALEALRELPEVIGGVGVIGFCFGGTQAFLVAAEYEPDVVVSYYGSGLASSLDRVDQIDCPLLLQFGATDPYIPEADLQAIRDAVSPKSNIEVLVQPDAGHAFDNHASEMFYDASAAAAAWTRTTAFLSAHLNAG